MRDPATLEQMMEAERRYQQMLEDESEAELSGSAIDSDDDSEDWSEHTSDAAFIASDSEELSASASDSDEDGVSDSPDVDFRALYYELLRKQAP